MPDIWFPYLGIEIEHLSKVAFRIGNLTIAWYGILVALGVVAGLLLARHLAKQSKQDPEIYTDYLIYALIVSLIGARAYYVAFEWDNYKDNLMSIFNFRQGGLAIYGAVIGAIVTALVFCKVKKYSFLELMDTAMPGLILGQAIGRWGNFVNQEAFGTYTDSIFAMRLNIETAAYTTADLMKHIVIKNGVKYIQVHPMFLYESFGCLVILCILLFFFKRRKFKGQILFLYMIGYGILRAFLETLRTDQLLIWNTTFPVSVLTSIIFAVAGVILTIVFAKRQVIAQKVAAEGKSFAPDLDDDEEKEDDGFDAGQEDDKEDDEDSSLFDEEFEEAEPSEDTEEETDEASEEESSDNETSEGEASEDEASEETESSKDNTEEETSEEKASEETETKEKPKKELTDEDLWD